MARVRISYDRDLSRIGSVADVDDDTARRLIREGRAVALPEGTKAELLEQARGAGVDVPASATKTEIASAIVSGE